MESIRRRRPAPLLAVTLSLALGLAAGACRQSDSGDEKDPGGSGAPTVLAVTPAQGVLAGGTAVEIETSGFATPFTTELPTVEFGGVPGGAVGAVDDRRVQVVAPAAAGPMTVDVMVTSGDLVESATLVAGFTYTAAPIVLSVSPGQGAPAGGEAVTISGDNFDTTGPVIVEFGGAAATGVAVPDPRTITCVTPPGAVGAVDVTVTNPDTQTGVLVDGYAYGRPAPVVTSVTPAAGDPAGGTPVTIRGSGFDGSGVVTVIFGAWNATGVTVVDARTITCTTPAAPPGTVGVTVVNPDSQSDTLPDAFTYTASPVVSAVTPAAGDPAGGEQVTIEGANFDIVGPVVVTFGPSAATNVFVASPWQLTCTTPAGTAGPVTVTVENPGGDQGSLVDGYTYGTDPVVTAVTPDTGSHTGGDLVTITGNNFRTSGQVRVYFDANQATGVSVIDPRTLTCTTPPGPAGPVPVTVQNVGGGGGQGTLADAFTYVVPPPTPTVASVSPNAGNPAGGEPVTITGTDFDPAGTTLVDFGAAAATSVTVLDPTTITCTTPASPAGPVTVTVTNPSGMQGSLVDGFTYQAAPPDPVVDGAIPNAGDPAGGYAVTITGNNFDPAGITLVDFGAAAATGVTVLDPTRITCTTPANPAGAVTVTVTNPSGAQGFLVDAFTYQAAPPDPIVTAVAPSAGDPAGGEAVTITGNNFDTVGPVAVDFGASPATSVVVVDPATITCDTPAGPVGPVTVTVTNPGGGQGSLVDGFTYTGVDPAVIASEDRLLQLINDERATIPKAALVHDPDMRAVARAHSEDMRDRNFFDHVNPDGDGPGQRLVAAGISYTAWSENIAWNLGFPDPPFTAFDGWMNSAGHKRNMLDENNVGYQFAGVGAASSGSEWWFTAVFVKQ